MVRVSRPDFTLLRCPQAASPRVSLSNASATLIQASTKQSISALGGGPAQADAHPAARQFGLDAHGRQHMRGLHLAGGTGRAGGYRETGEIEARSRRFRPSCPGTATSVVLGSRPASAPKMMAVGVARLQPGFQPVAQGCHAAGVRRPGAAAPPPPPRRIRRSRPHSRCRRAARAPGRRRGSADAADAASRRAGSARRRPSGRPSCAQKWSEDRRPIH